MSSSRETCLSAYWQTMCYVGTSSVQSIWSQAMTCKELLHVADSKRFTALYIDPVGDLLLYCSTICLYLIKIKIIHGVAVNMCNLGPYMLNLIFQFEHIPTDTGCIIYYSPICFN